MRAVVVALVLMGTAHADTAEPWKVGVTEDQKKQAKVLLDEGNTLFVDKNYAEALAKYQAAIGVWDHPAIRFNVVRALIQLQRTDEAAEELKRALQYGAAPLEEAVYAEALAYEKLLANQVAGVEISCAKDVKVTLDGVGVTCPVQKRIKPGRHQVVGARAGFLTKTIEVIAVGGETEKVEVSLVSLSSVGARIERRWPTWVPWAVFGGGLAIAGIGGLVELQALGNFEDFKREIRTKCGSTPCDPKDPSLDFSKRRTAENEETVAIVMVGVGAAAAITGGVMFVMNRGKTVYASESSTKLSVMPLSGGAAITFGGWY